jgi:DNA gyrase subunit A
MCHPLGCVPDAFVLPSLSQGMQVSQSPLKSLSCGVVAVGVVGMEHAPRGGEQPDVLSVCENGYGKRKEFVEYRAQNRGGSGVITIKTTQRNGQVAGIKLVDETKDLMVITEKGMAIRLRCEEIRSVGRNAQGVRLVKMEETDKVARVAPVVKEEERDENGEAELTAEEK